MNIPDLLETIRQLQNENHQLRAAADSESHSRLLAEEALGITEDRLQLALDAAGLASWEWDVSADVVLTSTRFGQLIGGAPEPGPTQEENWSALNLLKLAAPEDAPALRAALIRTLKQQDDLLETEFRVQSPQGLIWLECTGKVIVRDMLGRAERMIGIMRNITRRKQFEQAMHQARTEAETANRAKDEFLAHISHEIRTPLNGVIGMNNLLAQTQLSDEQRNYVSLVASSGRALLALVNDVLDYSRFSASGIVLEQIRFPLKRWLREAVTPLQVSAQAKGLELTMSAANDLPSDMVGDPGRMRQIVTNLVSNAVKFTERGSVSVSLTATPEDQLLIRVQDTGIGIAPDKQQSIFDAFVQADSSTSRRYGGTGLGLAICMQLAQAMGGRIVLDSQLGVGSCFSVWIPIPHSDETPSQQDFGSTELGGSSGETQPGVLQSKFPAAATSSLSHPPPAPYEGRRALVADDHEVNRLLAQKLLEQLGFSVTLAHDGMNALEAVVRQKFDVILMDIQMPELNGWQATHELRQWEQQTKRTRVPVIALSAHASAADREQALAIGMDGYLTKPLTPEALAAALRPIHSIRERSELTPRLTALSTPLLDEPANDSPKPAYTHARPTQAVSPLQRERLLARLGGDEAALRQMTRAMRRDLRESISQTYASLKAKDWPAMRAQAHAVKGALASVTADEAAALAGQLERCTDEAQASQLFNQLSVHTKLVFDTIKNW
jgi:PAS domain S-box-containing protein